MGPGCIFNLEAEQDHISLSTFIDPNTMNRVHLLVLICVCIGFIACNKPSTSDFSSNWPKEVTRSWIGPEYWTNRLQDWELQEGKLVCLVSAPNRNAFLLTRALSPALEKLSMEVKMSLLANDVPDPDSAWAGFRLGAKGQFNDYRDNALYGLGLEVGLTMNGYLFIRSPEFATSQQVPLDQGPVIFTIDLNPNEETKTYTMQLAVYDETREKQLTNLEASQIPVEEFTGGIALVSHVAGGNQQIERPSVAFQDWNLKGPKLTSYPDRAFGPILFNQYTLSKGTLRMTAQMPPVGEKDGDQVIMEVMKEGKWTLIKKAVIDKMARTATLEVENWTDTADVPYRLLYDWWANGDVSRTAVYEGTVRKDPVDKEELVVAGFTGNNDLGFPNTDLFENVKKQEPDILFFSGDQIYERVAGYGIQTTPLEKATLDYLRKWYLYGWAYGELMKDLPTIAIPDDHDVYHGNIWGEGGKAAQQEGNNFDRQDSGGFKMPPEWVNMVIKTQTAHLPAPYDPSPMKQGINVFYTDMLYGGISFAILEDRYFKSAPKALVPNGQVRNGWPQNRRFNAKTQADVRGAVLLGDRQLTFLEDWADDWSGGAWMKVLLSQTIFANVATLPEDAYDDGVVPKLRILEPGEYAENDRPVSDMDSNGWPQTGRNKALRILRKAFAFHLAGDQHLGSTIQYGVDAYGDAPYALCVPSISNVFPRRWYPQEPGGNWQEGMPRYAGDFEDGFGNKMTVLAISNPYYTGREPSVLYDRATGYGIVRFNQESRKISLANWARDTDPMVEGAKPYPGWPIVIDQLDNYGRKAVAYLPTFEVTGMEHAVIQVEDEANGEIVYTIRMRESTFRPMVFRRGSYTVRVGEPGTERMRELAGVEDGSEATVRVEF